MRKIFIREIKFSINFESLYIHNHNKYMVTQFGQILSRTAATFFVRQNKHSFKVKGIFAYIF